MNNKGFSKIGILIILIIVIGVGILAYQYLRETEEQTDLPETETLADETAYWGIYRNEEYGFEVKYPSIFQLGNQYGEVFLSSEEGSTIYIFAGEELSAVSLGCGGRCQYPESLVVFSEEDGDWTKDYIFDYGGMGSWDIVVNAYQQKVENYYILSLYYSQELGVPGMEGEGKPSREELIAPALNNLRDKNNSDVVVFNQILSTFKLID